MDIFSLVVGLLVGAVLSIPLFYFVSLVIEVALRKRDSAKMKENLRNPAYGVPKPDRPPQ